MMVRLRITFVKNENMQYTSHLDVHRTWERTFRRANLPLAYSQGYRPKPRINLGSALPLGITSECEIVDVWMEEPMDVTEINNSLVEALPPGLEIIKLEEINLKYPSLQSQITSSEYLITLTFPIPDIDNKIDKLLSSEVLIRERRGKDYDLRPLIENLSICYINEFECLRLRLSSREGATGRPEEVLAELGIELQDVHIHRTAIIFSDN